MAFAVDTTGHLPGTAGDTGSKTWTHVCGASANKLLVLIGMGTNTAGQRTINTATYNGVTLGTPVATVNFGFVTFYIFCLDSPATGSHTVDITSTAGNWGQVAAYSISYNDAAAGTVTSGSGQGTTAGPTTNATGIASGDHVVNVIVNDSAVNEQTHDSAGGATLIFKDDDIDGDTDMGAEYYVASGSSQTLLWNQTDSGSNWIIGWVAVRAAGGAGGQVNQRDGINLSGISAINGITKSGISAINGLTI